MAVTVANGNAAAKTKNGSSDDTMSKENPLKIFKSAWPAIMLANNLIAKLKILDPSETPSIGDKNEAIILGTPVGNNKLKKVQPQI